MAESHVINLINGVTVQSLGEHLTAWFQSQMGMESQGTITVGGYGIQARTPEDGWKTISGTSQALQVQITDMGGSALIECAYGKWSDKVGAGVVGWFVFAPLAVTAIVGSLKQKKLPEKVFAEAERFVLAGGQAIYATPGRAIAAGNVKCPTCGAEVPEGSAFCSACGNKMFQTCAACGAALTPGASFCAACGRNVYVDAPVVVEEAKCPNCQTVLAPGVKFCSECGTALNA